MGQFMYNFNIEFLLTPTLFLGIACEQKGTIHRDAMSDELKDRDFIVKKEAHIWIK